MKWAIPVLASILIIGSLGLSQQAFASPISVSFIDDSNCDPFPTGPDFGDELGDGPAFIPFSDESLSVLDGVPPAFFACPTSSVTPTSAVTVKIKNLVFPLRSFTDVIYVADPETTFTNFDGTVEGLPAFRIDSSTCDPGGANNPLVSETLGDNCIFEPAETWTFIIDDYANILFLPPSAIDSIGVPSSSPPSSGSIIAFAEVPVGGTIIPIDTTVLLVAGAQTISPWLVIGIVSAVGIGLAVFTLKRNR